MLEIRDVNKRNSRKERRQEQVREEILEATRRVLLDRGLAGLTLTAVAKELQLTKAALYYYFASKETLFAELIYRDLHAHAEVVGDAIDATTTGEEALEVLIRTSSAHYGERKDVLRLSYLVPQVGAAGTPRFDPEMLERIRPFNERMYGAVGARIKRDQEAGRVPADLDGRRLAFLAHTSVIGMITVEGLVETADTSPLIHSREAMVDDLVRTFRARLVVG